jgi:hypothetical protein
MVTLLIYIQEVTDSNLGGHSNYTHQAFVVVLSHSKQMLRNYAELVYARSFRLLPSSLFSIIRRRVFRVMDGVVEWNTNKERVN